jgi:hypothetical protein
VSWLAAPNLVRLVVRLEARRELEYLFPLRVGLEGVIVHAR